MKDIFLARQPIFDTNMDVFGYELLYRNNQENKAEVNNPDQATSHVLLNTFAEFGLETVTDHKPAFINIGSRFILDESVYLFPNDKVILEILEDITINQKLIIALSKLKAKGYTIVLNSFEYNEAWRAMIKLADIIKIDVLTLNEAGLKKHIDITNIYGSKLLAEKVETYAMYETCRELGFAYFQGYFLCHPKMVQGQEMASNRLVVLKLLSEVQNPDIDVDQLSQTLSKDARLSIKILKLINSAAFNLNRKIESIKEAVVLLGLSQIKKLANMILLSTLDDKPNELLTMSMTRAKQCEILSSKLKNFNPDTSFTLGLFSMLDALLNQPMDKILKDIPLTDEVKLALNAYKGELGAFLHSVIEFEHAHWEKVHYPGLTSDDYQNAYIEAIQWTQKNSAELMH